MNTCKHKTNKQTKNNKLTMMETGDKKIKR